MDISSAVLVSIAAVLLVRWLVSKNRVSGLDIIPGPRQSLLKQLWTRRSAIPHKRHLTIAHLMQKYGPIFCLRQSFVDTVFVSDYESIQQVQVTYGKEFGGRPSSFKTRDALGNTGILLSHHADIKWKLLRKVSQRHLRQFGDGMSRLESVIGEVAEDMFTDFSNQAGRAYDPARVIFDTALNSIAFLITGERTRSGDTLIDEMREYEDLFLRTNAHDAPMYYSLLNVFPFLKYVGFDQWAPYQRFAQLQHIVWDTVLRMNSDNPKSESICKVLKKEMQKSGGILSEVDARTTALSLLFAGVTTTSNTFYGTINILAHNPVVQKKIYAEIQKVMPAGEKVIALTYRSRLPYTRAVLYELLRYTSVVALSVPHRTTTDTKLKDYDIPAGTNVQVSIWNLHHDENVWEDPYEFKPERFLDDSGDVVPADHPNRKHLMPFGAGPRVCLGESLAMARLFLWISTLIIRYEIFPAEKNEKCSTDARSFSMQGVLKPTRYEVIFKERETSYM